MKKMKADTGSQPVMMVALIVSVLVITVFGALTYRSILASKQQTEKMRGSLSYLRTQIENHDCLMENGDLCVEIRDNGSILVLKEEAADRVYEIRIYSKNGRLMEDYVAAADSSPSADAAALTENGVFYCEWLESGKLQITTEEGTMCIALLSGKERSAE